MSGHWTALTVLGFAIVSPLSALAQTICTADVRPGVVVEISDGATGAPRADQARGVIIDASYTDSLRPYGSSKDGVLVSRQAGGERPGTYDVIVVHRGYEPWQVHHIKIGRDECHVRTVTLQAKLTRLR
jgi:hypothetical protein